jgi:hypothetical protein
VEYKEILGWIAVALAFACYIPIFWGIFLGTVKPHLYTYLVWSIITTLGFLASWFSGGAAGSWALGFSALFCIGVFILSFRYGTKDVTHSDALYTVAAVLTIVPWLLTKDPTLSIILAVLIEILSFFPTLRKTWNDPYSEPFSSWSLNTLKHGVSILALSSFSVATVLYPAVLVVMNALLAGEIIFRRSKKS